MKPRRAEGDGVRRRTSRTFRKRAMYENLMEEVVTDENCEQALEAVKRNKGAAGIDRMTTKELESHLQAHWGKDPSEVAGGNLRSESREAGRDTQAERRHADAGDPDGTGSVHSADVVARC